MVTTSTIITAGEYNNLRSRLTNVMGVGSGDSGYGQTTNIPILDNTRPVLASDLVPLRNLINIGRRHQVGGSSGFSESELPIIPSGRVVFASDFSKYENAVNILTNSRLNYGNGSMLVRNDVHTVTRPNYWGPRQTLTSVVNVLWADEDRVRWFFNSGGDLRLNFWQPAQGFFGTRAWNVALSKIGTIRFSAWNSSHSGSAGHTNNVGFYQMNGNYSTIFNGQNIDNPYPYGHRHSNYGYLDDVYVNVRKIANGLAFQIILVEENHDQIIEPGTSFAFSYQKAVTYLNNPVGQNPSFFTQVNL